MGCFQILAIVNHAAVNRGVHTFFLIGVLGFLGYIPRGGIAGSNGSLIFNFLRTFNTVFHSVAPICIPTNRALSSSPHPHQHFLFVDLLLPDCFAKQLHHCTFPLAAYEGSNFSTSLPILNSFFKYNFILYYFKDLFIYL